MGKVENVGYDLEIIIELIKLGTFSVKRRIG